MNIKKLNYVLVIVWLIIAVIAMFHHEIWRDEARVWWFLQEYDYKTLFRAIPNDGHPYLWYLILLPFAKNNFPVFTMQIVSLLSVFFSVCIFCFKSKFNFLIKVLFVLSSGMLYFLPVISRNYAIIPIFLFSLAVLYPKRNEHYFLYTFNLILLSQTHILMEGTSFILWLLFVIEQIKLMKLSDIKQTLLKLLNLLIFIIYAFFMLYIFTKLISTTTHPLILKVAYPVKISAVNVFVYKHLYDMFQCELFWKHLYFTAAGLLSLAILKCDFKAFLVLFVSLLFILYIFVHIWFGGIPYQKFFIITLIFVFCCMILNLQSRFNNVLVQSLLAIFLLISFYIFNPVDIIKKNIKYKFTNTKEIYDYLKKENLNSHENILLVDYEYTMEDTFKVYFKNNMFPRRDFKENEDYYSLINKEIEKRPNLKYIIVNSRYKNFINKTNLVPVILFSDNDKKVIYRFNTNEYYYLYKTGDD